MTKQEKIIGILGGMGPAVTLGLSECVFAPHPG
jgi:aspartate/glutamate racemase